MYFYTDWYIFVLIKVEPMSKAEKTKAYIIERTAPIFNTKGYAGTSLTDMTEATGLTKGSIYGNFSNKDDVALAAFDYNLTKVGSIIKREMDKHELIKDKLLVYVRVYEDYKNLDFPQGGCPILNTAIEADDTHPELKKRAADAIYNWKKIIVKLIERGIATGEFNKNTDAQQLALGMIAAIEGGIMVAKITGKQGYLTGVMQLVERMILDLK